MLKCDLKPEDEWTDVDWLRDRYRDVLLMKELFLAMAPEERHKKATRMLGEVKLHKEVWGYDSIRSIIIRVLRQARGSV